MHNTLFTKNFKIPKDVKVISFDVFDTLLLRPFEKPTDLFTFINPAVNKILQQDVNFRKIRKAGEKKAKIAYKNKDEITLDNIYEHIDEIPGALKNQVKLLEKQSEFKFIFARESGKILYNIAKESGLRLVVTSDTYFDFEFMVKILRKHDFTFDTIFCSSSLEKTKKSGSLYEEVIDYCNVKPSEILHIGDNLNSDIKKAQQNKLQTFHLPLLKKELYSNPLYKNTFKGKNCLLTSISIGLMCNNLDQEKEQVKTKSLFDGSLYKLGFNAFGGILFAYTTWVFNMAKTHNIKKLFFISRDGFILNKAFQILYNNDSSIECQYLECSRKSLTCLLVNDKKDVVNIFTKRYSRTSIKEFIEQKLECDPHKIEYRIREFGFKSISEPTKGLFPTELTKQRLALITLFYADEILERMKKEKQSTILYLKKMGVMEEGIAFCDVGYGGTVQKIISEVANLDKCFGFYLFTNKVGKKNKKVFSFSAKNKHNLEFKIQSSFVRLIESVFLSAPNGTLRKYTEQGEPIFEDLTISEEKRLEVNSFTWKGMIDFIILMKKLFGEDVSNIAYNINSITKLFNSFAFIPTQEDAKMLTDVVFENKSNAGGYNKLIENNLWKTGSLSFKKPIFFKFIKLFIAIWLKAIYRT